MLKQKETSSKSLLGYWSGLAFQDRLMVVMTLSLIVASFMLGYFYGQLTVLKGSGEVVAAANGQQAGAQIPSAGQPQQPAEVNITDTLWEKMLASPAAAKGPENSDVVMVEFTDYQCPFCSRHFQETDSQIQQNYVDNGKIRHIIRDLPLPFHPNAHAASQAARCAGDQNKYWEMHDVLFNSQDTWSSGDPAAQFSAFATDLGLNVASFDSCVSSEKYKQAVDDDLALASEVGASGTPTFFINGKKVVGAQPYSVFKTAIDAALAE
mgnify:CR=1 FL=1